ncbi:SET domain-containing protein-lysine N-methyltransferase [uncultured Microscilla sp.]|uniref:SET domain-containing protein-lysine N-methyltransferase n=1 Tax=uncultured Microscilla sp. TaxID=432653 RepID=UPI00260AA8E3|nr:SET domain-containing protein-lysine N-methyltransferase [uncultured Microscilla sp.]
MKPKANFTITHQFEGVHLSTDELQQILSFIGWNECPPFEQPGRVAWHILTQEASTEAMPEQRLKAAKIKGVGFWNPRPEGKIHSGVLANLHSEAPTPPTTDTLESMLTFPHMGINQQGEYAIAYSSATPIGGILHERALLEFNSARILLEHGVPSTIPLMVVQYEDKYQFKGKPMGVVVNLSPEPTSMRLSCIQYGAAVHRGKDAKADAYYDKLRASLGVNGQPELETTRLQTINLLARKIGKLVHDFSAAGLYRYSSEWSNFEYDFARKEVFLTDLDSTLELKNVPTPLQALQVLRDLGTAVYRLMAKFGYPDILNDYTLNNVLKFDPLAELLVGYFPEAPYDEVETVSQRLWQCFVPHWTLLKKHQASITNEWSRPRRQTYKMDHDLFYVLTMTLVFPLFEESDLFKQYKCGLTMDSMLQKAQNFLGERYEYFSYLLNGGKVPLNTLEEDGYELKIMENKGEGMIVTKPFAAEDVVMKGRIAKLLGGNHSHASQMGEHTWAIHEGIIHKVNHSCAPNCGIRLNETGAHDIVAIKPIAQGEELTLDYAMRNYQIDYFPSQCQCGAPECRTRITGWKDLPQHTKDAYAIWAAPYLLELDKKQVQEVAELEV